MTQPSTKKPRVLDINANPKEVFINVAIRKNEVTPWVDEPTAYVSYPVCTTVEWSPGKSALFREVTPQDEEMRKCFEEMGNLLIKMRGQWIHSVHASECLSMIQRAEELLK